MVKRLSAMQETQVQSLGWQDPLEKEMAAHSSILAWKIPWTAEPGRFPSMGSQRVRRDWATSLSLSTCFSCLILLLLIRYVVSDSLQQRGLQQTRLPCPPPSLSFPKLMSIESVMPSNHLILWRPLLFLPSIFPSIRVFSNEAALHIRWPKNWIFSFSISPSNEYSGLISFRIDWFDLLAVQGTL